MSGGRLVINLHPGGEIVPTYEQTKAVRDGVLDMSYADLGGDAAFLGNSCYIIGASGYPAGSTADEDWAYFYVSPNGKAMVQEVYKDYGQTVGCIPEGMEVFCYSHKPLAKAADFRGIKFRTIGLWAQVLQSFGASVVTIAGAEVYPSAEKGIIDAFEYGGPNLNWPMGFHEIMEYMGLPGIHSPSAAHPVTANFNSFNKLPDDLKQILLKGIEISGKEWSQSLLVLDQLAIQKYLDYGTKIFYVSDDFQAEIAKRSMDITLKMAAEDPLFKKIWDDKSAYVKILRQGKRNTTLGYSIYD